MDLFFKLIFLIENVLMWFYPPFKRFMPVQTYKYAATGGLNTAFDIVLYFISYNYILKKEIVDLGFYAISPHIAAFIISFSITFPTGYILGRYISFPGSHLRKRIQIIRYGIIVGGSIILNYIFLKIFVELAGWYPTPSKMITTLIVIAFSYISQKNFTFKSETNSVH